jgi:hypothetical protein
MKTAKTTPALDRLLGPLGECLTPEAARRVLALKADRILQARVDYLAGRCNEGRDTCRCMFNLRPCQGILA